MGEQDWRDLSDLTDQYDDETFITVPSFEWTSARYGHRNVYFEDTTPSIFPSFRSGDGVNHNEMGQPTPAALWSWLDGLPVQSITVPHHMSAAQFPLSLEHHFHAGYDRVAEIYSSWGDSLQQDPRLMLGAHHMHELAFIHSIRAGYKVGFVANSDSHDGHPGNAQGTPLRNHLYHNYGSGVTGILVAEKTRSAVFTALRQRACFAATTAGLAVATTLEGKPMGSETPASQLPERLTMMIEIVSDSPVHSVEIYRGGHLIDTASPSEPTARFEWTEDDRGREHDTSFFVRVVREDGETAWTSPHWVTESGSAS
jgi:hypothetical protein